jgi:ribonuclease R
VEVKLVEAIPVAGALRFDLISEGRYDLKLPRQRREPRPHRQPGRRRRGKR